MGRVRGGGEDDVGRVRVRRGAIEVEDPAGTNHRRRGIRVELAVEKEARGSAVVEEVGGVGAASAPAPAMGGESSGGTPKGRTSTSDSTGEAAGGGGGVARLLSKEREGGRRKRRWVSC